MNHSHSHGHDTDAYYLDQLCLIAVSGAFGGVCLTLYFWQTHMLGLLLAEQFHPFVLWSGVVLLALVLVRAATLWQAVGRPTAAHEHAGCASHDHGHQHHAHEHAPGLVAAPEGPCPALPRAEHEHGPGCDHDHGWAPWQYVLLLLPIMLYLLGLPNKPPSATAGTVALDPTEEAQACAVLIGIGPLPLTQSGLAAAVLLADHAEGPAKLAGFKELEEAAYEPADREHWQGQFVQVVGQFAPFAGSDRFFDVVRYRIQCCAADAIPLRVKVVSREGVTGIGPNDWVRVAGRVAFQEIRPGTFVTYLRVPRRQNIMLTDPDPRPYIQ